MKKLRQILMIALTLLILLCLYFKLPQTLWKRTKAKKTFSLGVVQPLSGELGNFGKTVLNGIHLAVDDFHERNPDLKINICIEDSQGKPANAVSAFQKLRDIHKVQVVIGALTSSSTLAIAPIAKQSRILLMSPTASNPLLSNAGPYFYRVWTSDSYDGKIAAEYMRNELSMAKVSILYLNNDYGVGLKDVFSETFTSMGGKVIVTEGYLAEQTDFRSVLTKIKNSDVDGLYLPGQPNGIGRIIKQGKELALQIGLFSCVAAEDQEFLTIAGDAAQGLYFTAPAFSMESQDPSIKTFVDRYRRRFLGIPDTHSVHGYDAVAIILSGVEKGYKSPEALRRYLDELEAYEGLSGNFSFDTNGDVFTDVVVKRYTESNKIEDVKRIEIQK